MNVKNRNSCRIARCADQQGALPPVRNQAEVETYRTGTNSTQNALEDHHTEDITQRGPHVEPTQNPTKAMWCK